MKIRPAGHRVVVIPDISDAQMRATKSGIILAHTEAALEQAAVVTGVIESIGDNAWKAFDEGFPWAKTGDRVLFAKYAGKAFGQEEDRRIILNDDDIIAVIEEEND